MEHGNINNANMIGGNHKTSLGGNIIKRKTLDIRNQVENGNY
jgi:hypothetical protein